MDSETPAREVSCSLLGCWGCFHLDLCISQGSLEEQADRMNVRSRAHMHARVHTHRTHQNDLQAVVQLVSLSAESSRTQELFSPPSWISLLVLDRHWTS